MIVRENLDEFILTRQNDHAHLSAEIARRFEHFFINDPYFNDALVAIYEHDRSWIVPDAALRWNLEKQRPYDFIDYPLHEKLDYYRLGLDETENLNPYAGLLCSMHYTSFINRDATDKESQEFLKAEQNRQYILRNQLKIIEDTLLNKHFQLLQLCDNLSLYVCLNRPGIKKEEEHFFFKNGFKNSSTFNPVGSNNLMGIWPSLNEINILPFPFKTPFETSIDQMHLSKRAILENGLDSAYAHAPMSTLELKFSEVNNA